MPIALILARADEVTGMNNKRRNVFLPKYAVTACINEWTRKKHEPMLNRLRIHVGATVAPMEKFKHARTFVGRTAIILRHLYRNVTYCIAIELPDTIKPDDFDFGIPVWAMQGSQLVPFDAEWHETGDPEALIKAMYRDHGRYVTGCHKAAALNIVMELESDSKGDELILDVYNPASRSKRLARRVTHSEAAVGTLNWTPTMTPTNLERSEQSEDWERLRERCKTDYGIDDSFQLQHHGWNPYDIVLPKRSVALALQDSPEGRAERDLWLGPNGFLSPITKQAHHEISLREGGPHRITPEWSFADQHRENQYFAHRKPPALSDFAWHLVTLKQPQMLQWVKEFAYKWGQQQEHRGFLVQGCQTRTSGRGDQVTGVTHFLISLERHSIDEARRYRGLIAAIEPAKPGNYISLALDPSRKKHRRDVFESLEKRDGIDEHKLFAHPETKSKAERIGVPKLYRFGIVPARPTVSIDPELLERRSHKDCKGFVPFVNNRGEGYVEIPAGNAGF